MITFRDFIKFKESNFNNHGGDRSTMRAAITRSKAKVMKPHMGPMHKAANKFFKI